MQARDGRRGLVAASRLCAEMSAETSAETSAEKSVPGSVCSTQQAGPAPSDTAEVGEAMDGPAPAPAQLAVTEPAPAATPRLRESDLELIHRTLQSCGGNVSDAAARLGVSRGLIYRRLRAAGPLDKAPTSP